MNEQVLSAVTDLLDRQPPDANVTGALVAALASGTPEAAVVTRTGFPPSFTSESRVLLYSFTKTIMAALRSIMRPSAPHRRPGARKNSWIALAPTGCCSSRRRVGPIRTSATCGCATC